MSKADVNKEILERWSAEQNELSRNLVIDDIGLGFQPPEYIPTTTAERFASQGKSCPKSASDDEDKSSNSIIGASQSSRPAIPPTPSDASPCISPPTAVSTCTSDNATVQPQSKPTLLPLTVVAGIDISFVKNTDLAVASLCILSFPELKVIHTIMRHVRMTEPYISGFLAFREVPLIAPLIEEVRRTLPQSMHPQLLFVDGNGVHHPRRFGFASHLGVVCDIPTIGCAKKLMCVEDLKNSVVSDSLERWTGLEHKGPIMPLIGESGCAPNLKKTLWGYAALTGNSTKNPIFISPGHRIGFTTALIMTVMVTLFRVPEPIRQADLLSRAYIRDNFTSSGELIERGKQNSAK